MCQVKLVQPNGRGDDQLKIGLSWMEVHITSLVTD